MILHYILFEIMNYSAAMTERELLGTVAHDWLNVILTGQAPQLYCIQSRGWGTWLDLDQTWELDLVPQKEGTPICVVLSKHEKFRVMQLRWESIVRWCPTAFSKRGQ